ncbi:allantoate amidohydrolase [Lichenihabitans sp. Uapishka_5]|uniref:allantoate amidohydrolase n=1 Tax=Lichenihabitans sp. Uapishka_5 TaxID=3037302 RepID=UPI0029E7DCB6|nr:allantoate amidohydrolase [Lichenihabitans sp. Uapishka_5]MDX7951290.1 allantoate amidohydrolase [Lichenihabitans sp. Uapishka_5]
MTWSSERGDNGSEIAGIIERLDRLAGYTDEPGRITRLPLTPAHRDAILATLGWMEEAGMIAGVDAAANVVGRYEGRVPGAPALVLGSHLDTVRDGGRFDGALGVVLAVATVERLHRRGLRLPFAIEVVGFGDEEGVRFGTGLLGSRFTAGLTRPGDLERRDQDGITVGAALDGFALHDLPGGGAARLSPAPLAYVEVHIEQGPVLERLGAPLGCVTAISGQTRLAVRLDGAAGHAGTVPMAGRRDALAGAAECVLAVERICAGDNVVGTVGSIRVEPDAGNVIPGAARVSLDVRAAENAYREAAVAEIEAAFIETTARRGLGLTITKLSDVAATPCAPWLVEALARAAETAMGGPAPLLPSGAGHDGIAMSAIAPVGMLFVRCRAGLSHHPDEFAETSDIAAALAALEAFVLTFDPSAARSGTTPRRAASPQSSF